MFWCQFIRHAAVQGDANLSNNSFQVGLHGRINGDPLPNANRPETSQLSETGQDLRVRGLAILMPWMTVPLQKSFGCNLRFADAMDVDDRTHQPDPCPTVDQAHLAMRECAPQFLSDGAVLVPDAEVGSGKDANALHA
jgi:hypothetical protein